MSAPASISARVPSAETTLPAATGTAGPHRTHRGQRVEHALLVPVRGVDDEQVDAGVEQCGRLPGDVAVHPDRGRDAQPARGVDRGTVDRRAQRAHPGQDADEHPVGVDDRRELAARRVEQFEGVLRLDRVAPASAGRQRHHLVQLGEPVGAEAVRLGHDADRPARVDDDDGAVRALGQQGERVADRAVRLEGQRRLDDEVPLLDPADDLADDLGSGCPAAARPARRGGPRSRPSAGRPPRSCSPRPRGMLVPLPSVVVRSTSKRDATSDRDGHHEHVVIGQVIGQGAVAGIAPRPVCWLLFRSARSLRHRRRRRRRAAPAAPPAPPEPLVAASSARRARTRCCPRARRWWPTSPASTRSSGSPAGRTGCGDTTADVARSARAARNRTAHASGRRLPAGAGLQARRPAPAQRRAGSPRSSTTTARSSTPRSRPGYPAALADWVPRDDPYGDALRDAQERYGRT